MKQQNKHVINALPLIADVLGRRYGVQVHIGGDSAYTDGKTIHLPSLPLDSDDTVLNLARAYIDHESGHLRDTDFALLQEANLSAVEKAVWNILEDYMVERKLSNLYPGCRHNLTWLIRHLFLNKNTAGDPHDEPAMQIFNWLLISVRSWDVPELAVERDALAQILDACFPKLRPELDRALATVPSRCQDTASCITVARELCAILKTFLLEQKNAKGSQKNPGGTARKRNSGDGTPSAEQQLEMMLESSEIALPQGVGEVVRDALQGAHKQGGQQLAVARPTIKHTAALSAEDISQAKQATRSLRTRLHALLQSTVLKRNRIGRSGRVETRRIHRVVMADPRVFARHEKRQGLNTAVHILLDSSSSMSGSHMDLACKACFAVASALDSVPGVSVAVSAFPGAPRRTAKGSLMDYQTVSPILKHKQKIHSKFRLVSEGGTPMAAALWWTLQQMHVLTEERKIILIISDGAPDSKEQAIRAIKEVQDQGIEIYGVGIGTEAMGFLLPARNYRTITELRELAPAMFTLLQNVLTKQKQGV